MFEGTSLFPSRQGKQWYQTSGFKEMAILNGAAQRSYRETVRVFNRLRRQERGGTALNTLRDGAEAEGLKVIDFLERKSQRILRAHGFDAQGVPERQFPERGQTADTTPGVLEPESVSRGLNTVCQAMQKREMSEEAVVEVREKAAERLYENPDETVHIYLDDVGVKEQKEHRTDKAHQDPVEVCLPPQKNQRPSVQNTVARIEHSGKGLTLTGKGVLQVLCFVLGFLLENTLMGLRLVVITDGQRSLQKAIASFFSWLPYKLVLLDWYHLVKKFREELSLACQGRELRNQHLRQLLPLLWFGLVDQAMDYLHHLPATQIKNAKAVKRLLGYLERNHQAIPCYALRSQLKLPNSSSPVERSNNLVTSRRQKHNGMSWSKHGSYALTALNAVVVNDGVQQWVRERTVPFKLVPRAA